MKLGIIHGYGEDSFGYVAGKGLEFIELCLNHDSGMDELYGALPDVLERMKRYKLFIGSVGRWGRLRIRPDGSIEPSEMEADKRGILCAEALGCTVYNAGANPAESLDFKGQVDAAAEYFGELVEFGKAHGVGVNAYDYAKKNIVCEPKVYDLVLPRVPGLGIKFDPSHVMRRYGNPLREMKDYGQFIRHFHIKGKLFVDGQEYDDPPAGLEMMNWGALMAMLYAIDYTGNLSIEPHSKIWTGARADWGVDYTIKHISPMIMR